MREILEVKALVERRSRCPICENHEMFIKSTGHIEWLLPYKATEGMNSGFRELHTPVYCPEDHEEDEISKSSVLTFVFHGGQRYVKATWEISIEDKYFDSIECGRVWTTGWKKYLSLLDPIVAIYYQPRILTDECFIRKVQTETQIGEFNKIKEG